MDINMNNNLTIAYMQDLKLIKECNEYESNVDDLTEENTTTIEESEDQTDMNEAEEYEESIEDQEVPIEYDDDGWSTEIQDVCNQLIEDFDGFSYELRNCKRGSFTGVDTGERLGEFLEGLKLKIEDVIDSVKSLEK